MGARLVGAASMQSPYAPPPYQPSPTPRPGWPPAARAAVGCGSGCAVLVLLQVLALWGVLHVVFGLRPPEGMQVSVTRPARGVVGKTAPLELVLRNDGPGAFTVSSLTVRGPTLRQVRLENPEPPPVASSSAWGARIWTYRHTVEPGQTWKVRFEATPQEAGDIRGSIEVQSGFTPPRPARFHLRPTEPPKNND